MSSGFLVWIRLILYTVVAFSVAWQTTMNGVIWDNLDWVAKSCLWTGIVTLWGNTMIAFFDKSMWKYDAEKRANGVDKTTSPAEPPKP